MWSKEDVRRDLIQRIGNDTIAVTLFEKLEQYSNREIASLQEDTDALLRDLREKTTQLSKANERIRQLTLRLEK